MASGNSQPFMTIRHSMLDHDMSENDLARMLGLSKSAVSKRLSKKLPWKLPELQVMAKKFKKSLDELAS